MSFQAHFDLDIPGAIRDQLVAAFDDLTPAPLADLPDLGVAPRLGVYGLFHHDELVYVGKADDLRKRLGEHRAKIAGRQNISPEEVTFACLTINPNWSAYAPETILVKYHKGAGSCEWNGGGFGPHDPGSTREETNKPPGGFDRLYPIKDEWPCDWIEPGVYPVLDLLIQFKEGLPYLLRFQADNPKKWRQGHADFAGKTVVVPSEGHPHTARSLLKRVSEALGPEWQATVFPSHMILYKEDRGYAHGEVL